MQRKQPRRASQGRIDDALPMIVTDLLVKLQASTDKPMLKTVLVDTLFEAMIYDSRATLRLLEQHQATDALLRLVMSDDIATAFPVCLDISSFVARNATERSECTTRRWSRSASLRCCLTATSPRCRARATSLCLSCLM